MGISNRVRIERVFVRAVMKKINNISLVHTGRSIRDWAIYVKEPFYPFDAGDPISWHSTQTGAKHTMIFMPNNHLLGIRLRRDNEWADINVDD